MLKLKMSRMLLASLGILLSASLLMAGCGDSEGDPEEARLGDSYVSPEGSIKLEVEGGNELEVMTYKPFKVTLLDSQGSPIPYVKIMCDTERGLSIVEPTTRVEHTNASGIMSGFVGGVSVGSYLMECRAPVEYKLRARYSIKVVSKGGTSSAGTGAGGNLGGGTSIGTAP